MSSPRTEMPLSRTVATGVPSTGVVSPSIPKIPPLENGDRLTREEFERRFEAMPNLKKAELIEGVVFMPSPVKADLHGEQHIHLGTFFGMYLIATPGVRGFDNTTTRLDLDNEPQPDLALMVDPLLGGQARIDEDRYLVGAPELLAEIAATSVSLDLGPKLNVYRRNGVKEYVVWRVLDGQIDWFVLRQSQYQPLATSEGIYRSEVFPGLWIDADALLRKDLVKAQATLSLGLQSSEHQEFVASLQGKRSHE